MTAGPTTRYISSGGTRIYRIPTQAFPMLVAHVHVVVADTYVALIDTGSGLGESSAQLDAGMAALRDEWGESVSWNDVSRIVITHAHIDHYGGLSHVLARTSAPLAIHELDCRSLTNHEERLALTGRALATYLREAGVGAERAAMMMQMHGWSKGLIRSTEVETVLHDGDTLDGLFRVYHTPGHCPGQVCLQVDDLLLCADHVLPRTSPHLAPEQITPSTGLEHYLDSLRKIGAVPGVALALGGHEEPITAFAERVAQIQASHGRKLERVLAACAKPRTVDEITQLLYPHVHAYDTLLALEEVGAHLEYLDQRGALAVANLDDIVANTNAVPRYRRLL